MDVHIIVVPYDSAHRDERMGAGPRSLLGAGLRERLVARGHRVQAEVIEPPKESWLAEIRTAFELARGVARAVRLAREGGRFPLVLTGNCGVSLGVAAALGPETRVVWCDAHGDFNTPETTVGGFLDGMGLATLVGRCWTTIARGVEGFAPLAEEHVWLVGARDLDPAEAELLDASAVRRVAAAEVDERLAARIAREASDGAPLYLHLDIDVMDPADGRANMYAAPGGVRAEALARFVGALARQAPLAAMTLSAYDPEEDDDSGAGEAAIDAIEAAVSPP
ncbi:MAG: arginase family protein [Gemmatimonadaceae bacterium]